VSKWKSWHGNKILKNIPWTNVDEDASVLLLAQDGSTGLLFYFYIFIY
jgi:hypothetical protein